MDLTQNENIEKNKDIAISNLENFLNTEMEENPSKVNKISYWIREYTNLLQFEKKFSPEKFKSYKRGDILKVNFGFRIGSELGGLHYCVVLDNNNSIKSPTITVVPLSSLKNEQQLLKLSRDRVYLGDEISEKVLNKAKRQVNELMATREKHQANNFETLTDEDFKKLKYKIICAEKTIKEFEKMKQGSIALVGQITTISKMRIHDPQHNKDVLSNIRLSNEKLKLIEQKITELYLYNK